MPTARLFDHSGMQAGLPGCIEEPSSTSAGAHLSAELRERLRRIEAKLDTILAAPVAEEDKPSSASLAKGSSTLPVKPKPPSWASTASAFTMKVSQSALSQQLPGRPVKQAEVGALLSVDSDTVESRIAAAAPRLLLQGAPLRCTELEAECFSPRPADMRESQTEVQSYDGAPHPAIVAPCGLRSTEALDKRWAPSPDDEAPVLRQTLEHTGAMNKDSTGNRGGSRLGIAATSRFLTGSDSVRSARSIGRWLDMSPTERPSESGQQGTRWMSMPSIKRPGMMKRSNTRLKLDVAVRDRRTSVKQGMTKLGMHSTLRWYQKVMDDPELLWGYTFIHSSRFNAVCSTVICLNALYTGLVTTWLLNASLTGSNLDGWHLQIWDTAFVVFFVLELFLRIYVERILYAFGHEWKWNLFDFSLVLLSVLDFFSQLDSNVTLGRLLRILRFFRVARLTRVVRHFSSLRLVLFAVLDSMSSLFWCFVLIFLTQFLFAVIFMGAATEFFTDDRHDPTDEVFIALRELFGGFVKSMVTLFTLVSGGLDWKHAMDPLNAVHPMYSFVLLAFIFLMQYGVLNIVVGTFVATAAEIQSKDKEAVVKSHLASMEAYAVRLRKFFNEADTDKSGTLSWDELRAHLGNRQVQAFFTSLDIDVSQAEVLYKLLDTDGSQQVTIDEFLQGCVRFKGSAKSIDLNMLMGMTRRLQSDVRSLAKMITEDVEDSLNATGPEISVGALGELV